MDRNFERYSGQAALQFPDRTVQESRGVGEGGEKRKFPEGKILWLVPNWECNRFKGHKSACKTCFAADVMRDAKVNGYQKAGEEFFENAKALALLPWKEVIITGGEPTQDIELLAKTLGVVSPEMQVRIVTNGDWIRDDKARQEVLSAVINSGKKVRIEVSAHDKPVVLIEKVNKLNGAIKEGGGEAGKVSAGIQIRRQETDYSYIRENLISKYNPDDLFIEERDILGMGEAVGNNIPATLISLSKLMSYSDPEESLGVHLVAGKDGVRAVVNHETPYLSAQKTPADISSPQDSPDEVREKVLRYYSERKNRRRIFNEDAVSYAAVAFRSGVPINFDRFNFHSSYNYGFYSFETFHHSEDGCSNSETRQRYIDLNSRLVDSYYQSISEKSGIDKDKIKERILDGIVDRIVGDSRYMNPYLSDPVTFKIAENLPVDPESLLSLILGELFISNPVTYISSFKSFSQMKDRDESSSNMGFYDQAQILGISPGLLKERVNRAFEERMQIEDISPAEREHIFRYITS